MPSFHMVMVWLHLTAIVVWIGGLVAIPFVVVPVLRKIPSGAAIVETIVRRFLRLSRELVLVIVLTGIFNVINAGVATGFSYSPGYLVIAATKFTLVLLIAGNQTWYSLRLAPRQNRRLEMWSSLLSAGLAMTALYLGLTLRYG